MSGLFTQLTHEYDTFSKKEPELERDEARARAETLLEKIRNAGENISNPDNRSTLSSLARDLGETIYQISGFYPLVRLAQFKSSAESSIHVPFGNREYEITEMLSSSAPAYYLIDAPEGYGKTELLKTLQPHFEEQDWRNAYVSLDQSQDISHLTRLLANKLRLILWEQTTPLPWGWRLSGVLRSQWNKNPKKGLVFLIDLAENPSPTFIQELLSTFIPSVEKGLRALNFFKNKTNRFRVILAGRYLAARPEVRNFSLKVLRLVPFEHQELQNSARDYLTGYGEDIIHELSAHLFYFTGGHPGCMAHILQLYKEQGLAPELLFMTPIHETIWLHVLTAAKQIRDGLRESYPNDYNKIDQLTVFRYMDYPILNQLVEEGIIIGPRDGYDLADDLTITYLFDWEGRFLLNNITRRILTILLRKESPNDFRSGCELAREMCATRLQQANVQGPEKLTIEYLFQSLQQHANTIQEPSQREAIRLQFFEQDLSDALKKFIPDRHIDYRNSREEEKALKQAIEEDGEFRFTLNYGVVH